MHAEQLKSIQIFVRGGKSVSGCEMRIFSIQEDGKFKEFSRSSFDADHEESVLESWLENNSDAILEDGKLLLIGRQVVTNLGGVIDLLGIDREGNTVVIELKRDRTPRDTLAQALEYASFVEELGTEQIEEIFQHYVNEQVPNLAGYHKSYFDLASDEVVSFNKEQRIVLVGQRISGEIRQTASFLRGKGLRVTCLEFSYFQANDGKHLLSCDIVVGKEPAKIKRLSSGTLPAVSRETFISSLDGNGRMFFERILRFAAEKSFLLRWGSKGFSMSVDKAGMYVPICYGYPPAAVFRQSLYTALAGQGGASHKLEGIEKKIERLWSEALATGLFHPAGRELKVLVNRAFGDTEVQIVVDWLDRLARTMETHDLKFETRPDGGSFDD